MYNNTQYNINIKDLLTEINCWQSKFWLIFYIKKKQKHSETNTVLLLNTGDASFKVDNRETTAAFLWGLFLVV